VPCRLRRCAVLSARAFGRGVIALPANSVIHLSRPCSIREQVQDKEGFGDEAAAKSVGGWSLSSVVVRAFSGKGRE